MYSIIVNAQAFFFTMESEKLMWFRLDMLFFKLIQQKLIKLIIQKMLFVLYIHHIN